MNIVIFTDTYFPKIDGIAVSVDTFTKLLEQKGHKFIIIAPRYHGNGKHETVTDNIEIFRLANTSLPSYPDVKVSLPPRSRVRRALKAFKPDVFHIQSPGLIGQYGVILSRLYNIPLAGTYHTMINEMGTYLSPYRLLRIDQLLNRFRRGKKVKRELTNAERKSEKSLSNRLLYKITNSIYSRGKVIISPTELVRRDLMANGIRRPIVVISNGIDLTRFKGEIKSLPTTGPKILHVGRISFEKNVEVVLKAFRILLKKFADAELTVYGDGPALASLKIEARQLGIADRVRFPGFIEREKLPEIYREYDLFLTASTMETQGLVVLEATASGLPSVGVNAYALPEIIVNGENGYIVEPFDATAMAAKAEEILTNPELYRRFSENGLKIATTHDMHRTADRLEALYVSLASRLPDDFANF